MTTKEIYDDFKANKWNSDHSEDYVVCACAKDEDTYLCEWIEHYLKIGFNKIIIADNNTEDTVSDILSDYISNGVVTIIKCLNMDFYQVEFYSLFCSDSNFKWCAFFDIDEFLEVPMDNVRNVLNKIDDDVACFNWILFGPNGDFIRKPGSVQERFKEPLMPIIMNNDNMFIKSIVRGGTDKFKGCYFKGSHVPASENCNLVYNLGGRKYYGQIDHAVFPPSYKNGYLKHYYTKSFDEWLIKSKRGWPDGSTNLDLIKYFMLKNYDIPVKYFSNCLFDYRIYEKKNLDGLLNDFDVIKVENGNLIYTFFNGICNMMARVENHTFIVDNSIDDSLYAILLEVAFKTHNRLICCGPDDDLYEVYKYYGDERNNTYYIITFI